MNELAIAHLRNGDEVPEVLVSTTMLALRELQAEQPIAFYELTEVCRDPRHELWGNTEAILRKFGLYTVEVHDAVRSIVLSAVTGDGFDLMLGSPL